MGMLAMDKAHGDNLKMVFSWKVLQSVGQVFIKLQNWGVTLDEFDEWLKAELKRQREESKELLVMQRHCPECEKGGTEVQLSLNSINTNNRNQMEGDWSSMWFCDVCGWSEMSTLPVKFEYRKYLVPFTQSEEFVKDGSKVYERVRGHIRRRPKRRTKTV